MPTITDHTKITPPRVPGVLHRPRLIEQISKNQDKRLLFILGQAAQGKSTLAAIYTGTQETPVAWLNLDEGDSDPVNLFYWLIDAFQHCLPKRDFSFLRSYPSSSRGPREPTFLFREWVQVMFEQINDPVQLVLDGLDQLGEKASSLHFLNTLVHESPPHLRLIMLSREEPPFGLQELKMKQQAQVLTNEDLAFSLEETRAFFRETRKVRLTSSQVTRIHSFTEGWVGGLLLFSEALNRLPEDEREKYISEKVPDRFKMEAFRFFEEAILSSQPPEVREFLIKSSVLDKMETQFIKHFLETGDMEEVLREAARKNLFVHSNFEEGQGWVFRYHQLFRDFLLLKFNTELLAETRKAIYLKAGLLFQQRGRLEEAIRYFLQAGAYESAVLAIEKVGMDLVWSMRMADLREWLEAIPEEIVQENPWLLYYLCMTRAYTAAEKNLPIIHQAFTLFEKRGDLRGCLASLPVLIGASILEGKDLFPMSVLLAKGEELLNTTSHKLYPRESSHLWAQIGMGHIAREGDLRKAYRACQNAYLIAKEAREIFPQINSLVRGFQALVFMGEIYLADEKSQEIEKLLKKHPYPEVDTVYHIYLGLLFLTKGDLDKAEAEMEFGLKECEKFGFTHIYIGNIHHYMVLKMNLGQYREVEELGQHILQLTSAMKNSTAAGIILFTLGKNSYFQGDYAKAEEYFQRSHEILSTKEAFYSSLILHNLAVLRGSLRGPGGQDETAVKDFQKALDHYSSISSVPPIDVHLAMAHISWQKGDRDQAVFHLHSGLEMARGKGITYFPYKSPGDIARLFALAVELGDQEDSNYVLKLLSTRRIPQVEPELESLSKHGNPNVRAEAAKIRLALHRSTLPLLRIETLGGFRVIRSGTPVKEEEWHGNQAKNLLKAIVAQGVEGVRKEVLMESLWPEGQPAKVENTFRSALHRLRRVLEPETDRSYGFSYVGVKDNLIYLDKGICEVDVDQFLTLLKEGEMKDDSQKIEEALPVYLEAADLYRGSFLPDDVYAEWAGSKREELKRKYLGLLFRTARIHEDRGAALKAVSFYKKAVECDPFSEEAYRRLMVLYSSMGKHNEALKSYKACEKALREGLDAEPEELTLSLYKKIENS